MYSEECESSRRLLANVGVGVGDGADNVDRDAMDHFRAITAAGERSERVLELTETIIRMNPAHYTIWSVLLHLRVRRAGILGPD